jgi:hypothetical protein
VLPEMAGFAPELLDIHEHRYQQVAHRRNEMFVLGIKWVFPKIVIQVADQMHEAFLLLAFDRVVAAVEVRHQNPFVPGHQIG